MDQTDVENKSATDYEHYSKWRMWVVLLAAGILTVALVGGSAYRLLEFLLL